MLRILYGTAGTGKSAAIMDEIRRGADSGERYILLVPEQYVHGTCARGKLRVRRRGK